MKGRDWSRYDRALAMRRAGKLLREIGEELGVCRQRASEMIQFAAQHPPDDIMRRPDFKQRSKVIRDRMEAEFRVTGVWPGNVWDEVSADIAGEHG